MAPMTQHRSAHRGPSPRSLLLILLALAVLLAAAYILSRPATPAPAATPTAGATLEIPVAAPTSTSDLEAGNPATPTPAPSDGFEAGVAAAATPSSEAAAAPRVTPSRTPVRKTTLTATVTRRPAATVTPTRRPAATATPTRRPTATPKPSSRSGLPTIAYNRLPAEARETIRLIQQGGPFPYRQDGTTFQNREGLLPGKARGYYREYTVVTPGSSDRGARRIIAGEGGELYYTDDHYASFREVVLP